jgi:hypothetical protein
MVRAGREGSRFDDVLSLVGELYDPGCMPNVFVAAHNNKRPDSQ